MQGSEASRPGRAMVVVAALYTVGAAIVALLGWLSGAMRLADWIGSGIDIKPNAIVALMAAGLALLISVLKPGLRVIAILFAIIAGVIGGATFFEHVSGVDLGIDTILFSEPAGARATSAPGRMGMPASASLVTIGLALILLNFRTRVRRGASFLGTAALSIASLSLIGYFFSADQLYSIPKYTGIAMQTATMIAAMGLGIAAAVPDWGIAAAFTRNDSGGLVFRRLVIPAILFSLVIGWLRVQGQEAGYFDAHFGTAVRTLVEIFLLMGLLWLTTNSISRFEAETRLISLMPAENPSPVMRISGSGEVVYRNPAAEQLGINWTSISEYAVAERFRSGVREALQSGSKLDRQIEAGGRVYAATFAPVEAGGYVNVYCSDITERKRSEDLLGRRANELTVLYHLADRVSRSTDLEEVYEAALDGIFDAMGCNRASILLFDDDRVMSFVASRGLSAEYREAVNGHSPWAYGETDCVPITISNIEDSDESTEIKEVITKEGIVALGFVPMISNGALIGKFMVYFDEPHEFTSDELVLAQSIAYHIAFGVDRRRTEQRRREVEGSLLEKETRFRVASRTGKVGIWDWDLLTGRVTWSESLYLMHGVSEAGFDGTLDGFTKIVHPGDRQRVKEAVERALAGEPYELELRVVRPDGNVIWIATSATVLRDGDTPIRMIGASVDITERKHSEAERDRIAKIVDSSNDAIISKDLNSRITSWNRAAEEMFGYTAAEAIGQPITILFPEDRMDEEEKILTRIRSGQNVDHYETVRRHKDGRLLDISLTISPIRDENGEIVGASKIARDITGRKMAEAARRESEIMHTLVDAQEAERHRIARDLHDHLGQQLTALRLKLESVRALVAGDPQLVQIIDDTREQAEKIDLDVNFLSWELRPTELETLGLSDALTSFVREWSTNYGIAAEFHAGPAARVRLDREVETNLYRIVQEGLNNILKHAAAKRVDILLEHRNGDAVLIIEDDGVGFDEHALRPRNERGSGGLGLVGMRERAAILGGSLEIETNPGLGTTVYARIPIKNNGN